MLYIGIVLGILLGSFMTVIFMALTKEVTLEKESGQLLRQNNCHIRKEVSERSSGTPLV